jgi:hypothetical protein
VSCRDSEANRKTVTPFFCIAGKKGNDLASVPAFFAHQRIGRAGLTYNHVARLVSEPGKKAHLEASKGESRLGLEFKNLKF